MNPLAIPDDVQDRAQGTLDEATLARAEVLLLDASAAVRDEAAGQQFTEGTSTLIRVKVRNGIVRLPQRPVLAVTAVKDDNDNDVTFTWLGDDRVRLSYSDAINAFELEPYRCALGEVRVTYDHGYEDIPPIVVAITCSAVLRALGRDPLDGSLMSESIEGYNYQTGAVGAAGPVGLLPEEKLRLARFARPHAPSRQ